MYKTFLLVGLSIGTVFIVYFFRQQPIQLTNNIYKYIAVEQYDNQLDSRQAMVLSMKIVKQHSLSPIVAAQLYAYTASVYDDVLQETHDSNQATRAVIKIIQNFYSIPDTLLLSSDIKKQMAQQNILLPTTQKIIQRYQARINEDNKVKPLTLQPNQNMWYLQSTSDNHFLHAEKWKKWTQGSIEIQIPSPFTHNSIEEKLEKEKLLFAIANRKDYDPYIINFWDGKLSSKKGESGITLAGIWQNVFFEEKGSELKNEEYSRIQKILAQSIADAFIETWKIKKRYLTQTPSMKIPNLNNSVADPPYPNYVSEYALVSETAGVILSNFFPNKNKHFNESIYNAINSRLVAGVNFDTDNTTGQKAGHLLANSILKSLNHPIVIPSQSVNFHTNRIHTILSYFALKVQSTIIPYQNLLPSIIKNQNKKHFIDTLTESGIVKNGQSTAVAWTDINSDDYQDLLIIGGTDGTKLFLNHNGSFTDVTRFTNLPSEKPNGIGDIKANSAVFGDYDNNGCKDLYIVRYGNIAKTPLPGIPDGLYQSNCDGTFTDVTVKAGIYDTFHGRSAAWADYNNDGYLDLYVANFGGASIGETQYSPESNILYQNNKNGTFTNVTIKAGVDGTERCKNISIPQREKFSFQPTWFDYNNDEKIDLFVATDGGISPLYKNNGDETFSDVTEEAGLCKWGNGMGITVGDYNNDGYLDLYVTNTGQNYFWHNNRNGTFTEKAHITHTADFSLGWGTVFFDYDNDGYLDLYQANGRVIPGELEGFEDVESLMFDRLYRNNGNGIFVDKSFEEGISADHAKEAVAIADYNNDGFLDIFVGASYLEPRPLHKLYRNTLNNNHYITIGLIGNKSNRDSIGSRITINTGNKKQVREITAGTSFIAQNSLEQTFGLGKLSSIDSIEINWPSGTTKTLKNIKADQKIIVVE